MQKLRLEMFLRFTSKQTYRIFLFLYILCAIHHSLRGSDCKYRESADKLRKSKILITCQKNTFGELSSEILLKPSGILLFREIRKNGFA